MMRTNSKEHRLVVCVRNDGYPVDLELRKIYRALPDREARKHGMIRVIDESGEDYLFPEQYFLPIRSSDRLREALPFEGDRAIRKPRTSRGAKKSVRAPRLSESRLRPGRKASAKVEKAR